MMFQGTACCTLCCHVEWKQQRHRENMSLSFKRGLWNFRGLWYMNHCWMRKGVGEDLQVCIVELYWCRRWFHLQDSVLFFTHLLLELCTNYDLLKFHADIVRWIYMAAWLGKRAIYFSISNSDNLFLMDLWNLNVNSQSSVLQENKKQHSCEKITYILFSFVVICVLTWSEFSYFYSLWKKKSCCRRFAKCSSNFGLYFCLI